MVEYESEDNISKNNENELFAWNGEALRGICKQNINIHKSVRQEAEVSSVVTPQQMTNNENDDTTKKKLKKSKEAVDF